MAPLREDLVSGRIKNRAMTALRMTQFCCSNVCVVVCECVKLSVYKRDAIFCTVLDRVFFFNGMQCVCIVSFRRITIITGLIT